MLRSAHIVLFAWLMAAFALAQNDSDQPAATQSYAEIVLADQPVVYWTFNAGNDAALLPHAKSRLVLKPTKTIGRVETGAAGPRPERFPLFATDNLAVEFFGDGGHVAYADPGDQSAIDFDRGDSLTLEAWVNCTKLGNDQQVYIVGKGRTKNPDVAEENQNYALRLRGDKGEANLSFLFRSADNRAGERDDFHRWNSKSGFAVDSSWHHVVVTYTFGDAKSIRGYIDGQSVAGSWDYGGATDEAPVVDNDELWLGSSLGGSAGNTFHGQIDEIAIYREALDAKRIAARYQALAPKSYATDEKQVPRDKFLVEVFTGVPDKANWDFPFPEPNESYTEPALALLAIPQFYHPHGVRDDRPLPLVLRASGWQTFPDKPLRLLLRSRDGARLLIDGQVVASTPFLERSGDGHNAIYPVNVQIVPGIRTLPIGDVEVLVEFRGTGRPQRVTLEVFAGRRGRRAELGETIVAMIDDHQCAHVLSFGNEIVLDDLAFEKFALQRRATYRQFNQVRRRQASLTYTQYWDARHARAEQQYSRIPFAIPAAASQDRHNSIDDYIQQKLTAAKTTPLAKVDDWAFLRRAALDTIGTIPSPELVRWYFAIPESQRRGQVIDRLLEQDGWADHWTSYWQDVLAENPNVINPTLNNTGPFRWWIHESFADNKPFDRFATELILMEGSLRGGGPAGFGMASQNDAPMAAKAHVIAQAFLGLEMKCARCHDAPYHDFTQKQLFSLAAMLKRSEESVPKTSTIPGDESALQSLLVKVTLKPGEKIPPQWPFAKLIESNEAVDLLSNHNDQREQLAALVTSPENHRFGQVIVNRMWQRYLGRGLVEPVDDWEHARPSHPELLTYLERELVLSGYDLKHVAKLILNSHTYQRQVDVAGVKDRERAQLFAGPVRRRLSAEQLVDSLFTAANKPLHVEELNIDVDGGRAREQSINLGQPARAWEFTSMSNERDRPALTLPAAQNVVDVLEAFGWRSTRPDPLTNRTSETNGLQTAILANGVLAKRISQLSDDSALTSCALQADHPETFIRDVYQRMLTREPTPAELAPLVALLAPGFETRIVKDAPLRWPGPVPQTGVSWSNHLKPEASDRKLALKDQLAAGDPPTARLAPDWRERAEDLVWTLINSPEFVIVP